MVVFIFGFYKVLEVVGVLKFRSLLWVSDLNCRCLFEGY